MKCKKCESEIIGGYKGFCKKCYWKDYYKNNKEKYLNSIRKYQKSRKGKDKINEYKEKNKDKLKKWRLQYEKNIRESDKIVLKNKMRCRLREVIRHYLNKGKIKNPVHPIFKKLDSSNLTEYQRIFIGLEGIDYKGIIDKLKPFPKNFLKDYQIDHIKPLNCFNFNNPKEIKEAFKPANLQILTIKQNQSKGSKTLLPKTNL